MLPTASSPGQVLPAKPRLNLTADHGDQTQLGQRIVASPSPFIITPCIPEMYVQETVPESSSNHASL